ncbi:MAG: ATP-binding protein, partial [Solirubrobacteraceae bacterium]
MTRPPLWFTYGNCVFSSGPDDGWAAFAVATESYAWRSRAEKLARLEAIEQALATIDADVQVLRVERSLTPADAAAPGSSPPSGSLPASGSPAARASLEAAASVSASKRSRRLVAYAAAHAARLRELDAREPTVFVLVSLREPQRDVASYLSRAAERHPREWLAGLRRLLAPADRRLLSATELERARVLSRRAEERLRAGIALRPATSAELQWLVRRSFCRGLGEPLVEDLHQPRALAFERNGHAVLCPLEGDVLRWSDCVIERRGRSLLIESELGVSWQAQLVLGALPEAAAFPGCELMFAPLETLPFGVDVSLNARFLPNELALRLARRRIQDADQIVKAEEDGEQGASDLGRRRSEQARDLLSFLQGSHRPPLLRASVVLGVGAGSEDELEERVEACRRAYGEIRLHRPLGEQLELFWQQLPGQRSRAIGYEDTLTPEQVAAMMPTAAHAAGAPLEAGRSFYLGHTLSGSRRPVAFNLREGSDRNRNTAILSVGALGSGKTTLDQKLKYEAFLLGARVIDCDPKGDHRLHLLDDVAPHVERITLAPDPKLRGVLDPLCVAPEHLRQEAALSFLRDLLPLRAEPASETALLAAVDAVMRGATEPTCLEVVRALQAGDKTDVEVAKTLEIHARSGLTQLGFADPDVRPPQLAAAQFTYIAIRDLPGPGLGTPRSEQSQSERVGEQIVRLIAMFAMHLMKAERRRLKVFSFDEGWRLLSDPVGRSLLAALQRMGRSELAVPIISTQLVSDALLDERSSLENLLGATFAFGMRSEAEAGRALEL